MTTEHHVYGNATAIQPCTPANDREINLHEQTRVVELFMAGDIDHAKQVVRTFCRDTPCCVTVTPTTFVYRGGEESGFVVAFRNYPRFPADPYSLRHIASQLGLLLRDALGQDSYMAVDHAGMTTWSTLRDA